MKKQLKKCPRKEQKHKEMKNGTENQEINKLNREAQYPTMNVECARRKGKEKERGYVSKL